MLIGDTVGSYRIVGKIGEGGMGEVFRAHDARLKRDVALKVLHRSALDDPDRRARFEREAQVLASLNHPNVAQIFGVEDVDGAPVLVMELVEGATLADRLKAGALPVPEALSIAAQVCDGLEAAHDRGIVHRDLKPANVSVRPDGSVKILDFGLARAFGRDDEAEASRLPTIIGGHTEVGIVLGTAAYMSPEQARGKPVDKRADIWAFGCLLHEMLTGTPAFAGETTTDILSAVIQQEPDWTRLPAAVPTRVAELLHRCLEKNPRERQRDIADARFELERAHRLEKSGAARVVAETPRAQPRRRSWVATAGVLAGGVAAGAALAGVLLQLRSPAPASVPPVRLTIALPPETTLALGRGSAVALSPDGQKVVFTGRSTAGVKLYLRSLDRFDSQPLAGTDQATNPFFSPDGKWVGFFAGRKLKKVSLDGGAPVVVTDAANARGEAWGEDDTILVTPTNNSAIVRVPALGGQARALTSLAEGELSHRWPRLLPGGEAVLFTVWNDTGWETARIVAQRIGSTERAVVVPAGGGYARYVRDAASRRGYLVFARAEGLLAAPFDEERLSLAGQPVPVLDGVITNLSGGAHFDVSPSGTLAFVPGTIGEAERQFVWVDLQGNVAPVTTVQNTGRVWALSPEGTRLVRNNTTGPSRDVFVDDLIRHTSTRITSAGDNYMPIWSRDGKSVIYGKGVPTSNLYRHTVDGTNVEERLTSSPNSQVPSHVSPDGAWLAYSEFDPVSGSDIWVRSLGPVGAASSTAAGRAGPETRPFVKTTFSEGNAVFSPDGRWLAYQSNESGRFEIFVRSFPDGQQKVQVSTTGGIEPAWAPSGRELLYRDADNRVVAVPLTADVALRLEPPRPLFEATGFENQFNVSPDGKRLLMMRLIAAQQSATQVHVVLNFIEELRRRVH